MSTVEQEIAGLKAQTGASSDAHLAEMLGYSRSAISQWKQRGQVPRKAIARAGSYAHATEAQKRMDAASAQLGHQIMHEGLCLALFIAPAFEASGNRFSVLEYGPRLRDFASFFSEVQLACAERIDAYKQEHGVPAPDAFAAIVKTIGKPAAIDEFYAQIMDRALQWRYNPTEEPPDGQ